MSATQTESAQASPDLDGALGTLATVWDRYAETYERYWTPIYASPARRLVALAAIQTGEKVLDIGTGTGLAALLAAPMVGLAGSVVGIDNSKSFLRLARAKAEGVGVSNVSFHISDERFLDLPDEIYDVVMSNFGIEFATLNDVLAEILRVLRPGGRVLFSQLGKPSDLLFKLDEVFSKYKLSSPPPELSQYRQALAEIRKHFWAFRQTDALRDAIEKSGFLDVMVKPEPQLVRFATVEQFLDTQLSAPSKHMELNAMPQTIRDEARSDLRKTFGPMTSPEGISLQFDVLYISGRKTLDRSSVRLDQE